MKNNKISTLEDYSEFEKLLKPLGFLHLSPGVFHHKILVRVFDFTACSKEGIPAIIFSDGEINGETNIKKSFNKLMEIKNE